MNTPPSTQKKINKKKINSPNKKKNEAISL